jgi:serine/threonine-protein kinase PknG
VYGLLPGEAAAKLALGFCAEARGDTAEAVRYFEMVWRTDRSHVGAAFGLARARMAQGDRDAAVNALVSVPATSSLYADAQVAAIAARLRGRPPSDLSLEELQEAGARLEALQLPEARRERLAALILETALGRMTAGSNGHRPRQDGLLGVPLTERGLRFGLAQTYRRLARLSSGPRERVALMDRANAVRPRTLI